MLSIRVYWGDKIESNIYFEWKAEAAVNRSKDFKQGGGGEKLKAKAKALEEAEKKNRDAGGPNSLKWSVS